MRRGPRRRSAWSTAPTLRALALVVGAAGPAIARRAQAGEIASCVEAAEEAQALRARGQLKSAMDTFIRCSAAACPRPVRADCVRWHDEVERDLPTIVVHATDPTGVPRADVRVVVGDRAVGDHLDGRPIPLDPGLHHLRFDAPGLRPVLLDVLLLQGQKNRVVEVALGRPPAVEALAAHATEVASSRATAPWLLFGTAALSFGVFAGLQLDARAEYSDLEAGCGRTRSCDDAALNPTRTKFVVSTVALGVGVLALAAGIAWLTLLPGRATAR